MLHIR